MDCGSFREVGYWIICRLGIELSILKLNNSELLVTQMEKHSPYSLIKCKTEFHHSTCDDKEHKSNVKITLIGYIIKLFSTSC
jgi:hypothetical protein